MGRILTRPSNNGQSNLRDHIGKVVLNEEEIPINGIEVHRTYQRTRWADGRVVTWLGRRKKISRNNELAHFGVDELLEG